MNSGKINETTTLCLPTEDEWRKTKTEEHDFRYTKRILAGT